jgi:hypothetical protein
MGLVGVYTKKLDVPLTPGEQCTVVKVCTADSAVHFLYILNINPAAIPTVLSFPSIRAY